MILKTKISINFVKFNQLTIENSYNTSCQITRSPIKLYFINKQYENSISYSCLPSPNMNTFKPRMSCDIDYTSAFRLPEQHLQPSTEAKQLIEYLKANPNTDINRKLRQEIFFKKMAKPAMNNTDMKKSSSQDKFQTSLKDKNINEEKANFFVNKTENRKKAGFFSPKAQKTTNEKLETSPFLLLHHQSNNQNQKHAKSAFRLRRDVMSLNQDLVRSQKQIVFDKRTKECPFFLKKAPKTTTNIQSPPEQSSIKMEDFVILKTLGQGTFGEVFAAIHKPTESIYTIKRYKKQIIKTHQLQDKFLHDIKVQLKFIHPHIVKLYGFFDDATHFYMVFEYMESGNLAKTIEEKGGQLPQIEVCRKIYQINDALLFLHEKRIIHRDIKPASVLTCLNVCKLCDTEWLQENDDTAHHNTLCKEIDYTAPEALQGKQITPEFDVWGLGLIAFELLTGKKFIVGNTQKILIRKIITVHFCLTDQLKKQLIEVMLPKNCSQSLRHLILSALEPVPSKRLKSSEINQMKIDKQKQLSANLLSSKNLPFSEKNIILPEKSSSTTEQRGSPKNGIIFGVKKQIKNEVSTLL